MAGYNNSANYQVSQYDVVTGGANNLLNNVASAASGTVLTSNGVSAQPSYQSVSYVAFPWSVVSGISQTCVVNNGYISSNAAQTTMYLPATAPVGAEQKFANIGTGFTLQPAYGQTLSFLAQTATYPQNLQTTTANAAMDIVSTNANTSWNVINNEGTFTQGIITSLLFASVSGYNTVYLKPNLGGTAWGAGDNTAGAIGNNTLTSYSSPVSAVGPNSYIQIYTSEQSTLALRGDGTCWGWGNNTSGQLGNGSVTSVSSAVSVIGPYSFIQISFGGDSNSASMGYGLRATGDLWGWGGNNDGQLGNQVTANSTSSPVSCVGNHSFIQVSAGYRYMLALKADGSCWSCGANFFGYLGNNTINSYSSPISVVGNHSFIQVAAGVDASLGLKIDGSCWAWGNNSAGQLAQQNHTNASSPVSVVGAHSFIQIASANQAGFGLKSNGQIWCWGINTTGQLGQQNTTSYSSPVSVVGGFNFVQLAYPGNDNLNSSMAAWTINAQLWAWGINTYGELGNNTRTSYSSPILVLNTP